MLLADSVSAAPVSPPPSSPPSRSILDGEAVVPAGSYVAWRVPADENPGQAGVLVGSLAARGGSRDPFAVAVLTESDYDSWKKGYRADPIYTARQVAKVELRARLPRPEVYYVVVSNPLPPPHASTIHGRLRLFWVPTTTAVVSTAPAPHAEIRRDLVSFGVVLLLAFALAMWSIYEGRMAVRPVAEKRAA